MFHLPRCSLTLPHSVFYSISDKRTKTINSIGILLKNRRRKKKHTKQIHYRVTILEYFEPIGKYTQFTRPPLQAYINCVLLYGCVYVFVTIFSANFIRLRTFADHLQLPTDTISSFDSLFGYSARQMYFKIYKHTLNTFSWRTVAIRIISIHLIFNSMKL